jgi:hypothetical protein
LFMSEFWYVWLLLPWVDGGIRNPLMSYSPKELRLTTMLEF